MSQIISALKLGREPRVIGLVSSGHFFSHFYFLVLPPLFPLLKVEFGVSYSALGLVLTTGALVTTIFQTPVGFLVDRFGARSLLILGLSLHSVSIIAIGFTNSFLILYILFGIAGLANTVYHPADYAILNAQVSKDRIGRAYSVHTFSGNIAWAIAPVVIVGLTAIWSWRSALIVVGLFGLVVAFFLFLKRSELDNKNALKNQVLEIGKRTKQVELNGIKLLLSLPIITALIFFIFVSIGTGAIRIYSVSALVTAYDISLVTANGALTGFLIGASGGILFGGIIADRFGKPELVAAVGFIFGAALLAMVGTLSLPVTLLVAFLAFAGFATGAVQPSRDMMVRAVTPEGSSGKVYAFVSTGLSIGGIVTPLLFGWIMDNADPRWVFWLSAIIVMITILIIGMLSVVSRNFVR